MYRRAWVFLFFVVAAFCASHRNSQMESYCAKLSGVDGSRINFDVENLSQSRGNSCWVMCMGYHNRKVNKKGQVLASDLESRSPSSLGANTLIAGIVQMGLKECANEVGNGFCDTAWKTVQCLSKNPMFLKYDLHNDIIPLYRAIKRAFVKIAKKSRHNVRENSTNRKLRPITISALVEDDTQT